MHEEPLRLIPLELRDNVVKEINKHYEGSYNIKIEGDLLGSHRVTDRRLTVEKLLAPLVPTDILRIGLNYREHAAKSGSQVPANPMLFIKASNTLQNPGDPILIPAARRRSPSWWIGWKRAAMPRCRWG